MRRRAQPIDGAVVGGLGMALTEETVMDHGWGVLLTRVSQSISPS